MLAEVRFTPIGTGEELKELIAKTVEIIEKSELDYQLTAMGVLIEAEWEEIMAVVRKCHEKLMLDVNRVITSIIVDDRKGAKKRLKGKVLEVEYVLGRSLQTGGLT